MEITMTFKQMEDLYTGFQFVENIKGVKLAYALAKNKRILEQELKVLDDIIKKSDEYKTFEENRLMILEKYTAKDPMGKRILDEKGNPKFTNEEAIHTEFGPLFNTFSEYEKTVKANEVKINLCHLTLGDIPVDITAKQMDVLLPIVKE